MDLEVNIPFTTDEGNRYVLEFSLSEDANDFVEIPVVEVAISLKKRVANTNSTKVFNFIIEPTLKSKACLKCLYFTIIIFDLCRYLEYFSYLCTINQTE